MNFNKFSISGAHKEERKGKKKIDKNDEIENIMEKEDFADFRIYMKKIKL